jgi:hypothetical protein
MRLVNKRGISLLLLLFLRLNGMEFDNYYVFKLNNKDLKSNEQSAFTGNISINLEGDENVGTTASAAKKDGKHLELSNITKMEMTLGGYYSVLSVESISGSFQAHKEVGDKQKTVLNNEFVDFKSLEGKEWKRSNPDEKNENKFSLTSKSLANLKDIGFNRIKRLSRGAEQDLDNKPVEIFFNSKEGFLKVGTEPWQKIIRTTWINRKCQENATLSLRTGPKTRVVATHPDKKISEGVIQKIIKTEKRRKRMRSLV